MDILLFKEGGRERISNKREGQRKVKDKLDTDSQPEELSGMISRREG